MLTEEELRSGIRRENDSLQKYIEKLEQLEEEIHNCEEGIRRAEEVRQLLSETAQKGADMFSPFLSGIGSSAQTSAYAVSRAVDSAASGQPAMLNPSFISRATEVFHGREYQNSQEGFAELIQKLRDLIEQRRQEIEVTNGMISQCRNNICILDAQLASINSGR